VLIGGLAVGKASTIGIEISPTPPLIFTVQNFKFEPSAFEVAARYPKSETKVQCCYDRRLSSPSLAKLGLRSVSFAHPLKLHAKNVLNRQ